MPGKTFGQIVADGVKGRTALLRNTRDEIVRLLKLAQQQIAVILAGQPTDYQLWQLPQLQKEINRILAEFGEAGAAKIGTAAGDAWQAGQDLVDNPIRQTGGAHITAALPRLDTRQLNAMRAFMTDRIKNISTRAANDINSELGLVVIGAQGPGDAITSVNRILGGRARERATMIVRTELGRVFSTASYARMQQAIANGANIRKKWIKSGKVHSRPGHDAIHGEILPVDQAFTVVGKYGEIHQLMFPHDPAAPAEETINCGCVCTPVASGFDGATYQNKVGKPDGTQYTKAELRARAKSFAVGKGIAPGANVTEAFNPNQPRDREGKWTDGTGVSGLAGISKFLSGNGAEPIVVAIVPADIKEKLGVLSEHVLLSRYTADKQKKHPEITARSYKMLQRLLNSGERHYDKKHHATVIFHATKPYVAVLKVTENGEEVYLQSFRRTDPQNVASLKKRTGGG